MKLIDFRIFSVFAMVFPVAAALAQSDITDYIEPAVVDEFNLGVSDDERTNAQPQRGGTLRVRTPADVGDFNPVLQNSAFDREVSLTMFETVATMDDETQEYYPSLAWSWETADLLKLKDGEVQAGIALEHGNEEDPASTVVFVPNARVHTFTKSDVEELSVDEGTLTLREQWGGNTYTGKIEEGHHVYRVNTAHDPVLQENALRITIADLDTWKDRRGSDEFFRPFIKKGCALWFHIRPGVTWHDGHPFTGEDYLFAYDTLMNVDVEAQGLRSFIEDVTMAELQNDGSTVHFRARRPYFKQFEAVAGIIIPLPKHVFEPEKFGGDTKAFADAFNEHPFSRKPIGTGPYKFAKWEPGTRTIVERYDDYWASKRPAGTVPLWRPEQPYMDRISYEVIIEKSVSLKELEKGSVDVDPDVEPAQFNLAQTNTDDFVSRFVRAKYFHMLYTYIGINNARPIFQDRETRRALAMLIPRERINRDILNGMSIPITGPAWSRGPSYDKSVPQMEFDPRAAKRMLRRAGWLDRDGDGVIEKEINGEVVPFEIEYLIHTARDYHQKIADIIKEEIEQAGIKLTIRKLEFNVFAEKARDKEFDMIRFAWGQQVDPDFAQIWHSRQIANKGDNFVSFSNVRADELIDGIREEFDPAKRWEMGREIHRILADEQPVIFLEGFYAPVFYDARLRGVTFKPSQYPIRYYEWWWADPKKRAGESG